MVFVLKSDNIRLLAEEKLADGYADYAKARQEGVSVEVFGREFQIPDVVLNAYERVYQAVQSLIGKKDLIAEFYSDIESGRLAKQAPEGRLEGAVGYKIDPETSIVYIDNGVKVPKNAKIGDVGRIIRSQIDKIIGMKHELGDSGVVSSVTSLTKKEMSYKQPRMIHSDFIKKAQIIGNLDELVRTMRNVTAEEMVASKANQPGKIKRGAEYYVKGDSTFNLGGKLYDVRVIAEVNRQGEVVDYDLSDIKEKTLGGGVNLVSPRGRAETSYTDNISDNTEDVKYKKQSQSVIYDKNDQYSPEANTQIEKLSRDYDPIINEELESNAEKHIAELGLADAHREAMQALGKKNITPQEKANALKTLQTLGEQSDTASLDRFAELSNKLAETSRTQAQLLQLNRILQKQSPTGMLNSTIRSIERAGGEVTPETTSAIKDLIDDVKSYDPKISELQDKIESIYAKDDYSSKIQKAKQGLDNLKSQISSTKDRKAKINLEAQAKILDGRIKSWKKQQDTITDQKIAEIRGLAKELNGLVEKQGYASSRLGAFIGEQSLLVT